MKRALCAFTVCSVLALLATGLYCDLIAARPAAGAAGPDAAPSPAIRERVIELPEDGGAWWVTTCLPDEHHGDADSRRLLAALSADPGLRSLQAQCKTHVFTADDPMFRAKWADYVETLPALVVQRPDGRVCYKASGEAIPRSPMALAEEIARAIESCRPRPAPEPEPEPAPAPQRPSPSPGRIPDIRPQAAEPRRDGTLLAVLAGLAGAAGGVATEWRKSNAGM